MSFKLSSSRNHQLRVAASAPRRLLLNGAETPLNLRNVKYLIPTKQAVVKSFGDSLLILRQQPQRIAVYSRRAVQRRMAAMTTQTPTMIFATNHGRARKPRSANGVT